MYIRNDGYMPTFSCHAPRNKTLWICFFLEKIMEFLQSFEFNGTFTDWATSNCLGASIYDDGGTD